MVADVLLNSQMNFGMKLIYGNVIHLFNSLWSFSVNSSIEGEDKVIVKFVTQNREDQVSFEDILPLGEVSSDGMLIQNFYCYYL